MYNIIGPHNKLSYGYVTHNIVKGFLSQGYGISFFPLHDRVEDSMMDVEIHNAIKRGYTFDPKAPCIRIYHQNKLHKWVGDGMKVGFPIFELDKFTTVEKHHLENCDKLFVCSQWAKDVVCRETKVKEHNVKVIPLGVDTNVFKPAKMLYENVPCMFYNIGKFEVRKGHRELVEAFKKTFSEKDNVKLYLFWHNHFCTQAEIDEYTKLTKHPNIVLLPWQDTQEKLYNIVSKFHCGVFPSKAEGWNLPALECLAMGKHLIITDYSAHTEYCSIDNSLLIGIDYTEPAIDNKWFFGQGNWAGLGEDAMESLCDYMKYIYTSHQNGKLHQNIYGIQTGKQYTWSNTVKKMVDAKKFVNSVFR